MVGVVGDRIGDPEAINQSRLFELKQKLGWNKRIEVYHQWQSGFASNAETFEYLVAQSLKWILGVGTAEIQLKNNLGPECAKFGKPMLQEVDEITVLLNSFFLRFPDGHK